METIKEIYKINETPAISAVKRPVEIVNIDSRLVPKMSFREDPPSIGKPIPYSKAEQCILAYSAVMKLHGFEETEGDINVVLGRSRKITVAEQFSGTPFARWIDYVHSVLENEQGPGPVKIVTKLMFGFYTDGFLDDPDLEFSPAERENKRGRITVFIVPVALDASKKILGAASEVYDFGSLQP
ncbi:hypothetical protein [Chitinophaga sp. CF418]|uniref:hypothetical protein n=1 Tax=Chitinophaga sp. CF418 TaxID=1855287 RepID=UPI00090FAECC|nr:hypothetical protein [Chitinophaga sp. CF418]SHM23200.1 hypothetical protein SAMN05216311_101912 [Chitinophaga sp. CF418]